MRTLLFIEKHEVELTDDVQFLLNKQFEELNNPTTIINDWSKTISIPFTESNNRLFGYIYKPEKVIITNGIADAYKNMFMYFDPTKKLDFQLIYNGLILMTGYAKMNEIKQYNSTGKYEVTLFGQLGKIFQELNKITFNVNDENSDYIIDGTQYVSTAINKALVVSSWNSNGQSTYDLANSTVTDIIGFAPNNSYYEEFDPKSFQNAVDEAKTFTDVLKNKWDDGDGGYVTGIEPETAIPNGMLPRDIGEFRSYYQTPYIYWNKLWLIFQAKAEQLTGYTWELDNDWFNSNNPYYSKLVYMLKPFNVKNGTSMENHYTKWGYNANARSLGKSTTPGQPLAVKKLAMPPGESVVINNKHEEYPLLPTYNDPYYASRYPHYPTTVATFKCPDDFSSIIYKWNIPMYITTGASGSHLNNNVGLIVLLKMWGCDDNETQSNARLIQTNSYIIRHEGSGYTYSDYIPIDTGSSSSSGEDRYTLPFTISSNFSASAAKCGPYCYFTLECSYTNDNIGLGNEGYTYYKDSASLDVNLNSGAFRSGVNFTLNDLWDNSYNLFEQILNYCKIYRILIFANDADKKLQFIKATTYFQTYSINDWTEKVDLSKDFVVTPITFDKKYVLFNYEDNKSKLGGAYKDSWGVNYGEKRLITDYNFNEDTQKLFDKKITSSITSTDFSLSWTNLYDYNKISYSLPAEIFPYAKDKDNKHVNNFGSFYFHNGKRYFDTAEALRMRSVKVSDDTAFQLSNDTYYYSQSQDGTTVTTYPALDIVYSDNKKLCLFNKPMENYTYAKNIGNTTGIFDMFWKMYINERYNIQNKKVTCYLRITPADFTNFEYKNFIKINNVVYFINKIYDYNITSSESTKVDLISIQDPTSYYIDYFVDYLNVSPDTITIDGSTGYRDISVSAYMNDWNYKLFNMDGNEVINPTDVTLSRINNTTLRVTKNTNIRLNYTVNIYTITRSTNVAVEGAASKYIEFIPDHVVVLKNGSTEFDMRIVTNYTNIHILTFSNIQWYNTDTQQWENSTDYSAADNVSGWASGDSETLNNNNEPRDITVHMKIVNPPQTTGNMYFYETQSSLHNIEVPFSTVPGSIGTLNSDGSEAQSTDSVGYHGYSSIRGYQVISNTPWTATLPQGVRSYGATSGDAGRTNVTFDWGSGALNSSKSITFSNTGGDTCTLSCTYVND